MNRFLSFIEQLRSRPIWQLLVVVTSIITFVAIVVGLLADLPAAMDALQFDDSGETGPQVTQPVAGASDNNDVPSAPTLIATPESATSHDPGDNSAPMDQLPTATLESSTSDENEMLSTHPPTEWLVTPNPDESELPSFERAHGFVRGQVYSNYMIEPVVIPNPSDPQSGSLILSHIKIVRGDQSWEMEGCETGSFSRMGRLGLVCGFSVYVADSNGANRTGPLQPLATEVMDVQWSPIWSPDGTTIIYIGCNGLECALYEQAIGADPVQVSPLARRDGWISLSGYSDDGLWVEYSHVESQCSNFVAALNLVKGFSLCLP